MADSKVTALTNLGAAPASGDILPIVDVSDTTQSAGGTTKKVTKADLLTGYLTDITGETLGDLSDVSNASATSGQVLKYNGSAWAPGTDETASGAGAGDMLASTYDAANVAEQLVGLTATQTLTNKTLTLPTITLKQSASAAPTAEGDIQWDTDDNKLKVGDGAGTKTFSDDASNASTYAAASHSHDSSYYTETEVNNLLTGYSATGHDHDSRYYTEGEVDTLLTGKSATGHAHVEADITDLGTYMANPMTTAGDIIYGGASGAPTRLGVGTDAQVLTVASGMPTWTTAAGGGAGGPRSFTYVIAASNSRDDTGADAVCDGTADNVEIQAGIDAVNTAGGGTVMLLDGTYEIDATVNLKSNVCLAGQGRGTVLTHSDATVMLAAPSATTITNVEIRDIYFNGNNQTGIIIDDVGTWNHCRFHDLWFYDVNAGCIDGNSGFDYCEFWNLWADNCKAFVRGDNHCSLRDSVFGKTAVKTNADNFIVGFDDDSVIEGCWINCSGKTLTTVGAVKVDENGIIRGNTFYQMYATTIKPAARGQIIEGNNFIEDATGSSYKFAIEVQANADGLVVASNNFKDLNNTGNGCIRYASGAVGGSVVGNSIINCTNGIHHTSLTSGLITGNRISVTSTEWALSIADGTSARYGDVYGNLIVSGKRSPEMRTEVFENVSGGVINAGSVVVRSTASTDGEEITTTTTSGDANVCGIAIGNITNATYSRVLTKGIYSAALVDGSGTSVAAGDYLMASTSAGKLIKATTGNTAIAIARAAVSTDTTAKIEVIAPRLI